MGEKADLEAGLGADWGAGLKVTAVHVFDGVADEVKGAVEAAFDVAAAFDVKAAFDEEAAFGISEAGAI